MDDMTDREFLRYCEIHCTTPVGMFHRHHIARLMDLAGQEPLPLDREWYRPSEQAVKDAVLKARTRCVKEPA